MDRDLIRYIGDTLAMPAGSLSAIAKTKREESIREAKGWACGPDVSHKLMTRVYEDSSGYSVSLAKPGKEAAPGYEPSNAWDMTPVVHLEGGNLDYLPSFSGLFSAIQNAAVSIETSHQWLELLGHLFVRNAYMVDHNDIGHGVWRYGPPEETVALLESVPTVDGLPLRVFLQVIEAIALNEDVKYTSRFGKLTSAGRVNTLLTFAHLCAVFTSRAALGDFAGAFSRPPIGVSPISQTDARRMFPLIEPDSARIETLRSEVTPVRHALQGMRGRTVNELLALKPESPVSPGNKGRTRIAVERALEASLREAALERFRKNVMLKVIRVREDMTPVEDVSFAPFDNSTVISEPWPGSGFRRDMLMPAMFVAFAATPKGDEPLVGAYATLIPLEEIETDARATWQRTVGALRAGRRDLLPGAAGGVFFVRNHAGKKVVDEVGNVITPLSFWLTRHYVRDLILASPEDL